MFNGDSRGSPVASTVFSSTHFKWHTLVYAPRWAPIVGEGIDVDSLCYLFLINIKSEWRFITFNHRAVEPSHIQVAILLNNYLQNNDAEFSRGEGTSLVFRFPTYSPPWTYHCSTINKQIKLTLIISMVHITTGGEANHIMLSNSQWRPVL